MCMSRLVWDQAVHYKLALDFYKDLLSNMLLLPRENIEKIRPKQHRAEEN